MPGDCLKVAESGISAQNIGDVLTKHHFNAALIGTSLLKSSREEMKSALDKIQYAAASAYGPELSVASVKQEASYAV